VLIVAKLIVVVFVVNVLVLLPILFVELIQIKNVRPIQHHQIIVKHITNALKDVQLVRMVII